MVHRDIAARRVLISTASGDFDLELAQVDSVLVVSDGKAAYGSGPVRWMAPESIHQKAYTGARAPGETLTILAGSYFTAEIIPSPASGLLFGGGALLGFRRRR